jgi:hypothetical protein
MRRSPLRFWILAALLAANLVVGVLSLYFIRSVNDRYAALFEDGAPAIYNLRTLTREVTGVQRLARRVTSPEHEPEWAELVPLMAEARERLDTRVHDVGTMAVFQDTPHPAAIRAISAEYAAHGQRFLELARAGRLAEAMEFNLAVLRPCHDRFQQTLDAAADHIEEQGRNLRDRYAKDSRFFGVVSLAFASVPIVAVSVGALVMTALLGLLLLVVLNPRPDRRS